MSARVPFPPEVRTDEPAPPAATTAAESDLPRVIRSEALFAGATQLAIEHDRAIYFLRQTRSGKLILTK